MLDKIPALIAKDKDYEGSAYDRKAMAIDCMFTRGNARTNIKKVV